MSHMVIYRGADGKPGYHQTDDIHDAVGFVEQMRNDQGVEHARIFRLEEVVFQYKPYYRVELAESGPAELGAVGSTDDGAASAEAAGDSTDGSANANGGNGEVTITANGGASSPSSGSADATPAVTAGSSSSGPASSATTGDDAGGSKRGLFGR